MTTKQPAYAAAGRAMERSDEQNERNWSLFPLVREILASRGFFAGVLLLSLLLYVWNAPHTIDYQEFDEATYFYRAFLLAHGNIVGSGITDPGSSPLYTAYYAFWYLLLKTSNVYPMVMTSSILLLGLGAYLLLSRVFHPILSWAFAVLIVTWSVPFAPNNLYIFATAFLWLSLAVLGRHPWQRGLAATLVLLSALVRPEYLAVELVLIGLLVFYEAHRSRRQGLEWRVLATAYAPVVILLIFGIYLYLGAPQTIQGGSSYAIAWSYTDFYRWAHPAQFDPVYSYANPYTLFKRDFGPLPAQASFIATLIAMTHNPTMMGQYLSFESARLIAGFGTAMLDAPQWRYDHLYTLPVLVTQRDTLGFLAGVAGYTIIAGACYFMLWRQHVAVFSDLPAKAPVLLGLISLSGLVPLMILINPHQRFFMLYPLALLPIALGVRCIALAIGRILRLPAAARYLTYSGIAIALLALALVYLPQPFAHEPPSGPVDAITLAFLRQHVPEQATIIGQPADSYAYYLIGDGYNVTGIEAGPFEGGDGNVINNIVTAHQSLNDVYILFNNNIPYQQNNPWFAAWNARYPELPITLVAQRQNPYLALYHLPPELSARVDYLQLLHLAQIQQPGGATGEALPPYTAMDFTAQLVWKGDRPQNDVTPQKWQAYGWTTHAITLYPDLPGAWNIRAHTVTTTLPSSWSGQTLVFAGAFAPWEVSKPQADGTQLVFTIPGTTYQQVVQLPNSSNQHWHPILVHLPRYTGDLSLQVSVLPRNSLLWDDTLLSFIGLARTATPASAP